MSSPRKISESTVRRLSSYLRILESLAEDGTRTVPSDRLAELGGLTAAQVRKDLSQFGNFGVRGRGYAVEPLARELRGILGLDRDWPTVVVGAGRLGSALTSYPNFATQGFRIVALFDTDSELVGRRLGDAEVLPAARLTEWVREHGVCIGILTTPARAAQPAADALVAGGIRGILNFTPTVPVVPAGVAIRHVNLAIELEGLSWAVTEADAASTPARRGGAS